LQEAFGVKDEGAFKAASGLHGGIGGKRDVCGALLGSGLMLGLIFGESTEEALKPEKPYKPGETDTPTRLVGELYSWFKREFGTVKCRSVRKKYSNEVNAEPDAAELTDMERLQRTLGKCDRLAAKTAARTAEMILDNIGTEGKIINHTGATGVASRKNRSKRRS
jgi:C_GCAxxG_C_C family probable redox protein